MRPRTRNGLFLAASLLLLPFSSLQAAEPGPQVVAKITQVDVAEQEINPPNLKVTATGEVNTGGYSKTRLVRAVYVQPPEDGIQDYFLMSVPPDGPAIQVISAVSATDTWKSYKTEAPWLKGIRVHGSGAGIVVKPLGGKAK